MLLKKDTIKTEFENIYYYFISKKKVIIPIFQRFYSWNKDNVQPLLDDILANINENYKQIYLLDFIYYEEENEFKLADGQQRLVSLNLLVKALNDYIDEHSSKIEKLELINIEYEIKEYNDKYVKTFNYYIQQPFKKVYMCFKDFIEENSVHLEEIIKILKNNLFVFLKKCNDADDAYLIFQQINTGGDPLTKDEIIKAAIEQYSRIYNIKINRKLRDYTSIINSYINYLQLDNSNNFNKARIFSFLRGYITKDRNKFQNFVNVVDKLVNLYDNPLINIFAWINRKSLERVLNLMCIKDIDTSPNSNYCREVILPLCLVSIVVTLNNGLPSIFNSLLDKIIADINNGEKAKDINYKIISYVNEKGTPCKMKFDKFVEFLSGDSNNCASKGIKKALLCLDIILSNKSGIIDLNKINLEHVYPQKPNYEWAAKGWPTSSEEQKRYINNIGNQFLLCEEVNKKIQNKYITDKIEKYKQIINKDMILQTEINKVDFIKFKDLKKDYILKRQKEVATSIKNNFPLGSVVFVD